MNSIQFPTAEAFSPILNSQSPQEVVNILKSLNKTRSKDKQSEAINNDFIRKSNDLLSEIKNEIKYNQTNVLKIIDSDIIQNLLPNSFHSDNPFFQQLILPNTSPLLTNTTMKDLARQKFDKYLKEDKKKKILAKQRRNNFSFNNQISMISSQKLPNSNSDFCLSSYDNIPLCGSPITKMLSHSSETFHIAVQKPLINTSDKINNQNNSSKDQNIDNSEHTSKIPQIIEPSNEINETYNSKIDVQLNENLINSNNESNFLNESSSQTVENQQSNEIQSILVDNRDNSDSSLKQQRKVHFFPIDGETVPPNNEILDVAKIHNQQTLASSQKEQLKMIRATIFQQIRSQYLSERISFTKTSHKSQIKDNILMKAPFHSFTTIYKSDPNDKQHGSKHAKQSKSKTPHITSSLKSAIAIKTKMINSSSISQTGHASLNPQYDFSPSKNGQLEHSSQFNTNQSISQINISDKPNNFVTPIRRKTTSEQKSGYLHYSNK